MVQCKKVMDLRTQDISIAFSPGNHARCVMNTMVNEIIDSEYRDLLTTAYFLRFLCIKQFSIKKGNESSSKKGTV